MGLDPSFYRRTSRVLADHQKPVTVPAVVEDDLRALRVFVVDLWMARPGGQRGEREPASHAIALGIALTPMGVPTHFAVAEVSNPDC